MYRDEIVSYCDCKLTWHDGANRLPIEVLKMDETESMKTLNSLLLV